MTLAEFNKALERMRTIHNFDASRTRVNIGSPVSPLSDVVTIFTFDDGVSIEMSVDIADLERN